MSVDANQIARRAVVSLLGGASSTELEIAGVRVTVAVSRDRPAGSGVSSTESSTEQSDPPPVIARCSWPGGSVSLNAILARETIAKYDGDVCFAIFGGGRCLLWSNVRAAIDRSDGALASIEGSVARLKRGVADGSQAEINRVLQNLVSAAALPMCGKKVQVAEIELPGAALRGGAAAAFRRALLLALLKLDFVARRSLSKRGAPLVDVSSLGLSDAALAELLQDDEDASAEDDDSDAMDPVARIRKLVERAAPDAEERRAALELLAYAVENAHDERPGGWYLRDRAKGVWLVTGRLAACRILKGTMALSVMGPVSAETRAALGAEEEENEAWKAIPGGLYLRFPLAKARVALELLKDPFDRFVDEAMARMRRRLDPSDHVPGAVDYLSQEVGRALPQPDFGGAEALDEPVDDLADPAAAGKEPIKRGRAPIFDKSQRSIVSLVADIVQRRIALPDLQRPFVWPDTKVRDLLDSLFIGFPTGTLVLWRTDEGQNARGLGTTTKATAASSLVIDGQQRLTSLYAVMEGVEIVDNDGARRQIKIAFRPRDGRFDVPDAAILQDPEYLPDVTELWSRKRMRSQIRREMLEALRTRGHGIDAAYEDAVEHNLDRLDAIRDFEFPVVEIRKDAASDEDVADIFVRINNQGTKLGQADFVLTLLSVFHGPLRDRIEARSAEITRESMVAVGTQQLLRATCAVGFERARMSAIYRFLRGVDPDTGDTDVEARKQRLDRLDAAADDCMDPTTWRDYLLQVSHAGFVNQALVASSNAVVNSFAFYVKGMRAGLERHRLDRLIARWLFATLLTRRYSGSSETVFEADLARTRDLGEQDGVAFAATLDGMLAESISGDYWSRGLVAELRTQKSRAPSALGFRAAQIVLDSRALFSDQLLRNFLTPGPAAKRSASEQHHLFPEAWLKKKGITDRKEINQVANLGDVSWTVNSDIGASSPSSYVPRLREKLKLDDLRWGRMCAEHALPLGWETMRYEDFLPQRRDRMADIIRAAFRRLGGEEDAPPLTPPWFLPGAELVWQRIVESERGLRAFVREIYARRYGDRAADRIEANIPERERESLSRALRARPAGADPLSVVDYLYIAQLPALLFSNDVWADAKERLGQAADVKQRLTAAIALITPVRNEIAHVREVSPDRLQRANVACGDVLGLIGK